MKTRTNRRNAVKAGLFSLAGLGLARAPHTLTMSDWCRGEERGEEQRSLKSTADSVIFVNLAGGPSHLDTLDMKPEGPAETRGEFTSIQTKLPGLLACEHMPQFAKNADRFTLLRGISHTVGDHPQGQAYIATGNRPGPALKHPALGAIVSKEIAGSPDLPPFVAIPQTEWNAGFMGDSYSAFNTNAVPTPGKPFAVRGITLPDGVTLEKVARRENLRKNLDQTFRDFDTNSELLEALDTFGARAYDMMTSARTREAFDVSLEADSMQKLFGTDEVGQGLLLATRLVEFGIPFVTVTSSGWDTHLDNFDGHRKLIPPVDAAMIATLDALQAKGLLERTLVVVMGEFGRTPKINQNVGRDHYPRVNWCLLAGGGVRPGQLIGGTDAGGEAPDDDTQISPDDIGATILHALGIDHHSEYFTRTGRPVSLIPHGTVLENVFG
jgi:hypothetical protein